jgi:hypothetical protein
LHAGHDRLERLRTRRHPLRANEDLERSTAEKTSSVHFLRFEFPDQTVRAARTGANWTLRSEHPNYSHEVVLSDRVRESLLRDFD